MKKTFKCWSTLLMMLTHLQIYLNQHYILSTPMCFWPPHRPFTLESENWTWVAYFCFPWVPQVENLKPMETEMLKLNYRQINRLHFKALGEHRRFWVIFGFLTTDVYKNIGKENCFFFFFLFFCWHSSIERSSSLTVCSQAYTQMAFLL